MKKARFTEREKLERYIDNYNYAEKSKFFNFFPKFLNKEELLTEYDKKNSI